MSNIIIPRAVNVIVNETTDLGEIMMSVEPGGIKTVRKDFKAAGSLFKRNPIVGFELEPLKLKVVAYPEGLDELPCHIPITLSFYEHFVNETDQTESGHRIFWQLELEKASEPERKGEELPEWEYQGANATVYRRYVDGRLMDEGNLSTQALILNGEVVWENRNRLLGRA